MTTREMLDTLLQGMPEERLRAAAPQSSGPRSCWPLCPVPIRTCCCVPSVRLALVLLQHRRGGLPPQGTPRSRSRCNGSEKLKKGKPQATVTFRLDGDPNSDTLKTVKNNGKAKAKFKRAPAGEHTVELLGCDRQKRTVCP